jgi:uncharacterized Zn-binding protein involved in type VI secretion
MPGFLMHVNAVMSCFHQAGQATIPPTQPRVLVNGQPIATVAPPPAPLATVVGCPFQIPVPGGTKPQPCVSILWSMPSTRFLVNGLPAALLPAPGVAPGICQSAEQIPQGAPTVKVVQTRVIGS